MQINSDSPSPFFGLQLAVDAETPAVQIPSATGNSQTQPAKSADAWPHSLNLASDPLHGQPLHGTTTQSQRTKDFKFTASENRINGDLKMALPKSKPKSGSQEAEQLADLLHRLKRS